MPSHEQKKSPKVPVVGLGVAVDPKTDKAVGDAIVVGEHDPSTGELEGAAFIFPRDNIDNAVDSAEEYKTDPKPGTLHDGSAKSSSSYGYSEGYAAGYENIDWGKVTKN